MKISQNDLDIKNFRELIINISSPIRGNYGFTIDRAGYILANRQEAEK